MDDNIYRGDKAIEILKKTLIATVINMLDSTRLNEQSGTTHRVGGGGVILLHSSCQFVDE